MVSNVKRKIRILAISLAGLVPFLAVPMLQAAPAATMSISPASGAHTTGQSFTINIFENSGTEPVNAAEASISYPASMLNYVSVTNSSAFSVVATTSGGGGTVDIQRGALPPVSGNQLIASVTFNVIAAGTANITFNSASKVVSANTNSDIAAGQPKTGGSYSLTNPVTPPPPTPPPTPSPSPSPTPSPSPSPTPSPSPSSGGTKKTNPSPSPSPSHPSSPTPTSSPAPSASSSTITNLAVSGVTANSATITWSTSAPATSEVLYGVDTNYVLTAGDGQLVTSHKVVLGSNILAPGGTYHFIVRGKDSAGVLASSTDQTFKTKGIPLAITVVDQKNTLLGGAEVTLGDATGTTDKDGKVTLNDLPIGNVTGNVTFKGKKHPVSVEIKPQDSNAIVPQDAKLTIHTSGINWLIFILPLIILLLLVWGILLKRRNNHIDDMLSHFPAVGTGPGAVATTPVAGMPSQPAAPVVPQVPQQPGTGATIIRPSGK
jgi:outer membrane biosynthesis protein TonB